MAVLGGGIACVLALYGRMGYGCAAEESTCAMVYAQRCPDDVIHHSDHDREPQPLPSPRAAGSWESHVPWVALEIASITQ
jgi:hypothetical protein